MNDCPNCATPWKCNGPHFEKINDSYFKFEYGYFIFEQEWVFVPFEKHFSINLLEEILENLKSFSILKANAALSDGEK